jgi:hypothetical protein
MKRYIRISTKLVNIAIPALPQRVSPHDVSHFGANRPKCLCMKYLHTESGISIQAQSRLIKPNQGIFVNIFGCQSIALNHYHFGMN